MRIGGVLNKGDQRRLYSEFTFEQSPERRGSEPEIARGDGKSRP